MMGFCVALLSEIVYYYSLTVVRRESYDISFCQWLVKFIELTGRTLLCFAAPLIAG